MAYLSHMLALRRLRTLVAGFAAVLALAGSCRAQEAIDESLERRVKAAFLYRFMEYVTWPEQAFARPDAPVVIGVMAAAGITDELVRMVAGRSVGGRPVAIRALRESDPVAGLHALFIGQALTAKIPQIAKAVPGAVLVVTESEGALTQGAVINFLIADGRVRFEVALLGAEKRALRLSARLLSVAMNVRKDTFKLPMLEVVTQMDLPGLRWPDAFQLLDRIIHVR